MASDNEFKELNENVKELTRTLRGHNGTPGVVSEIIQMRADLKNAIEKIGTMNEEGCRYGRNRLNNLDMNQVVEMVKEETSKAKKETSDAITWKWLREKLGVPIAIAIILGIINLIPVIVRLVDSVNSIK
jgi:septation ring formation regulator EzrA